MGKIITTTLCIIMLSTYANSMENYDTTSFRTVTKLCSACHGTPFYMSKQIDDDDWEYFFENEKKLLAIHKNKPKGIKSLKSTLFKKRKKRLLKFFINNSKYSGKVHGCDANFCGTRH